MTIRSTPQKIGSQGHKWLVSHIQDHPDWLSRDLNEDFGVDIELELTEPEIKGDILKIQVKSATHVEQKNGLVRFTIERKYIQYADSCRYPFILIYVDVSVREAWYLWLQDWLIIKRATGHSPLFDSKNFWTEWVPITKTVRTGLDGELKSIARWEGKTQLALSLVDAMRAASSIQDKRMVQLLTEAFASCTSRLSQAGLNMVIDEAIQLGDRMRNTDRGNEVAEQLFSMVRQCGNYISAQTIDRLVLRGESYSRSGINSLAILYDEHFRHISSLCLPIRYSEIEPRVAFYCAFREANPEHKSQDVFVNPSGFIYADMKYLQPDMFWDKYANRGPSALLDYLEPIQSS